MTTTDIGSTTNQAELADSERKKKHATMWAWGDYPRLTVDVISDLGPRLVEFAGISTGQRVLDVAAGSGNASIPAAALGADVVASDLTPELLVAGEKKAADAGVSLTWEVADAEHLQYTDASFDAVISSVGVMFAPHHQESADELVRVLRPGGTLGLLSWTPSGFIGQMFAAMKPYAAPPPAGAQPPPLWGDLDHVTALLGDRVEDVKAVVERLRVTAFASPEEFRDYFKACYGPTIGVYKNIADDPAKVAALDAELAELAGTHFEADGTMAWEYLLFSARKS
ncbi:class I SAM-dependent methyltransferase [Nocardioides marmorisolisilvae]|uniref:Class I SAM-dependent methyltransferase n=1 Tax=Nocardioides marmorisolisilvae TaxID=1542737 RepID=A0A3N0DPZ2_9ACTN|nr:class I SAM-dependent methyltransferase [Nocardioides marmorisolisilvae]RNL77712.1 class I SAM-dependent methyltransferase [Nocardioides marmorisolisilvae]